MKHINAGEPLKNHIVHNRYMCGQGFCGQCRCKLVKGRVSYPSSPICNSGEVLPCIAVAETDVTVEV